MAKFVVRSRAVYHTYWVVNAKNEDEAYDKVCQEGMGEELKRLREYCYVIEGCDQVARVSSGVKIDGPYVHKLFEGII